MSGSKVYVKKPLRRYERAFEEEMQPGVESENGEESGTQVNPDITSPAGIKGPLMNSKKQPLRYKVKPMHAKSKAEIEADEKKRGEKEQ